MSSKDAAIWYRIMRVELSCVPCQSMSLIYKIDVVSFMVYRASKSVIASELFRLLDGLWRFEIISKLAKVNIQLPKAPNITIASGAVLLDKHRELGFSIF